MRFLTRLRRWPGFLNWTSFLRLTGRLHWPRLLHLSRLRLRWARCLLNWMRLRSRARWLCHGTSLSPRLRLIGSRLRRSRTGCGCGTGLLLRARYGSVSSLRNRPRLGTLCWPVLGNSRPPTLRYRTLRFGRGPLRRSFGRGRWTRRWGPVRSWQRAGGDKRLRLGAACPNVLRAIGRSFTGLLNLRRHGSRSRVAPHSQFRRRGPRLDSTAAAVVTDPIATVVRNSIFVNVVNYCGIHIGDRAIVFNRAVVPIRAIITAARISEAVIDAAVEADMWTPIARVSNIEAVLVTPVWRRPQRSNPGCDHPSSGDPIVTGRRIIPVTGRPEIVVFGTRRLAVLGKRRRRLRSLYRLLIRRVF
jgi:hypothetical protein